MKFGHYGIIPVCKAIDQNEIIHTLEKGGVKVKKSLGNIKPFVYLIKFEKYNCYLCESKHFRLIEWAESYPFYEAYFHNTEKEVLLSHVKEVPENEFPFDKFYRCGSCKKIGDCGNRDWNDLFHSYGYRRCEYYKKSFISRFRFINKIRIWMATHNIFGEMI